ncbi:hypothetical protein ACFZDK_23105 [Streptomyces sp. NPDC007901]|uniref:hypothetical protein n=1 Tax=Streptomyces sp. NPDC007901 TaxID=3364785 RepID=UPI0036ED1C33
MHAHPGVLPVERAELCGQAAVFDAVGGAQRQVPGEQPGAGRELGLGGGDGGRSLTAPKTGGSASP